MNFFFSNNSRAKKMAWMLEPQWAWHIVFTDAFSALQPKQPIGDRHHKQTFFGCSTEHLPQAPPTPQ
jgi:hypothetical protein